MVPLLRITDVAVLLSITPARAYELARRGVLPCVRLGRQVRVDPERLEQWIAAGGHASDQRDPGPRPTDC